MDKCTEVSKHCVKMSASLSLMGLVCLLLSCHASFGERILEDTKEIGINATSLAPGYTPCPQLSGANGIFQIEVPGLEPFPAYCEANIAGPGWIVIARRTNEERNFFLNWQEYKRGFGNLAADFFIGLDKLHGITGTQNHELYVFLEDFDGQTRYARYDQFYIENENMQYQLSKINGFSGDAGDSFTVHLNMKFTTFDRDNDLWNDGNCASEYVGAWWHKDCTWINVFGLYLGGQYSKQNSGRGMFWKHWLGTEYSYKTMIMMVRPTWY